MSTFSELFHSNPYFFYIFLNSSLHKPKARQTHKKITQALSQLASRPAIQKNKWESRNWNVNSRSELPRAQCPCISPLSLHFSIEISTVSALFYRNFYFLLTFLLKSLLSLHYSVAKGSLETSELRTEDKRCRLEGKSKRRDVA